ncbi:Uncharacterised protein [Segatella copri]|nr:Uncharacterised protein [Segatella copri]
MTRSYRTPLAELLEVFHREETTQSQTSIEHRAHVTWVEEEAVTASPCWICWIINQVLREEHVDEVRTTHSTTWVTGICLFYH